jgi:hypothetical protein
MHKFGCGLIEACVIDGRMMSKFALARISQIGLSLALCGAHSLDQQQLDVALTPPPSLAVGTHEPLL